MTELCTRCHKCGLPRKGHFDRKSRREKRRLIGQPTEFPVATYQLAAVAIQTVIRSFLIQLRRRRNLPVEQWRRQCVHFLSTKGPYGRCSQLNEHRRLHVYNVAATEIQVAWRNYRWLRHLQLVGPDAQRRNAIVLQRAFRASVSRRFYSILLQSMRDPASNTLRELIEQDGAPNATYRLGISSSPFALYYRMEGSESWKQVDAGQLLSYMREQVKLQQERARRRSSTAKLQSPSTRRRSKKEDVAEQRRERIRKASRRKFKWFHERQERSGEQPGALQAKSEGTTPDDSEVADVLAWLEGVDFDAVDNL